MLYFSHWKSCHSTTKFHQRMYTDFRVYPRPRQLPMVRPRPLHVCQCITIMEFTYLRPQLCSLCPRPQWPCSRGAWSPLRPRPYPLCNKICISNLIYIIIQRKWFLRNHNKSSATYFFLPLFQKFFLKTELNAQTRQKRLKNGGKNSVTSHMI